MMGQIGNENVRVRRPGPVVANFKLNNDYVSFFYGQFNAATVG